MSFKSGEYYCICEVCGVRVLSSEIKHRWDGYKVCTKDYENRHPLDFLKVPKERIGVPFSTGKSTPIFASVSYNDTGTDSCTAQNRLCLAGIGTAGCMTVGLD